MEGLPAGDFVQMTVTRDLAGVLAGILQKEKILGEEEGRELTEALGKEPSIYFLCGGEGRRIHRPTQVSISSSAFPAYARGH